MDYNLLRRTLFLLMICVSVFYTFDFIVIVWLRYFCCLIKIQSSTFELSTLCQLCWISSNISVFTIVVTCGVCGRKHSVYYMWQWKNDGLHLLPLLIMDHNIVEVIYIYLQHFGNMFGYPYSGYFCNCELLFRQVIWQ